MLINNGWLLFFFGKNNMKRRYFNILTALVNIASFWVGFKVFTLGNDFLLLLQLLFGWF